MSENGGGWPQSPRPPRHSRGPGDPRQWRDPLSLPDHRMPQAPPVPQNPPGRHSRPQGPPRQPGRDAWRPDAHLRPLPPEYAGQPVQASYDPGEFRPQDQYGERGQHGERGQYSGQDYSGQDQYSGHDQYSGQDQYSAHDPYSGPGRYPGDPGAEYEEDYEAGDRFVPGFGDDDGAGYEPGRASRGTRRARRDRGDGRGRRKRRLRWIAPLVALLVIFVPLATGGVYAYSLYMSKYHPADYSGDGTGSVVVQVTSGDTATSLAPRLERLGVVASSRAFVLAAEHNPNSSGLLPGFYGMHLHMQASLAYAILINPQNMVQIKVTIPEGWRLSQIVSFLGAKSGIGLGAYQKVLKNPAQLHLPGYANGKPEGYLFPATYAVQPHETARGVLTGMVRRFQQEAAAVSLPAAARQVHLTQAQVVVMASLLQAEGGRLSDYPKIARVIYNRLAHGIPLQLDSTVLYGLNKFGILASDKDLTSPSPYNTYKHKGLPPGPIDSPGAAAIQAVLHPAAGNWLYFVTVNPKTGETLYTSSPAQFEQFRQELERNLAKG
jgi:UPF0755 protein